MGKRSHVSTFRANAIPRSSKQQADGNNTYAETYLTPTAVGTTWYWSQAITPAILGTVFVVINDHNQTKTITSTNSAAVANNTQYLKNGTLSLLTRTDVNELGTVTAVFPSAGDREIVV